MLKRLTTLLTVLLLFNLTIELQSQSLGTGISHHSIVTHSDGTVYTWGYNSYGELGNQTTTQSTVPVAVHTGGVLSGKSINSVSAGLYHSLAVSTDGIVYAWGYNNYGQLGNTSTTGYMEPIQVHMTGAMLGKTIIKVASGYNHSLALADDGTVYAWGGGTYGQLGEGNTIQREAPVAVDVSGVLSGKTIVDIAAGNYHSVALDSDGKVYTWGNNGFGGLGDNTTNQRNSPVAVNTDGVLNGKTITAIAACQYHTIVCDSDGKVYGWGYNGQGQLGDNSTDNSSVPKQVFSTGVLLEKTIVKLASGNNHTLAVASDGTVYGWGINNYGQLGDGTNTQRLAPIAVTGSISGVNIVEVAAGHDHSLALGSNGKVYCWGRNNFGQLGNNTTDDSNSSIELSQVLPVELISFTSLITDNNVLLNWSTQTEINNFGFEIERASSQQIGTMPIQGGEGWETLGFVKGNGNSNSVHNYSFTDDNISGKYLYRLKQIDNDGSFEYSKVIEVNASIPTEYRLKQNYPNPFNPATTIEYQIPLENNVSILIYNSLGQLVKSLVNETQQSGRYKISFDGESLTSGIYYYQIKAGSFVQTKKMILMK